MYNWNDYSACRFLKSHPARLRHEQLVSILGELKRLRPDGMQLAEVGRSYEGRAIYSATLGHGPTRVFAWSQMHGNEPTHTASLLDLMDLLQSRPDSPVARTLLGNCTLSLVPMLNPDGAERFIRRNAQDIDINRDALHLATPEGRLLRQLVQAIEPHFAFNLHNQQARTSVDGKHVAAVSLLVPPIDSPDTQTDFTRRARQVAVAFRQAVEPHCQGMISRYDADFMPRCFGEWVQQQAIATLTVEAGGWSSLDTMPLTRVHTVGLINALMAIGAGSYEKLDPAHYDALPRSSDQQLFDVIVRKTEIVPYQGEPFPADLGINFTRVEDRLPQAGGGKIDDLGDLCVTTGKVEIDGAGLRCVPGGVRYAPEFTPERLPTSAEAIAFLNEGITTVIGKADRYVELAQGLPKPALNVGFVDNADDVAQLDRGTIKLGAAADLVFYRGKSIEQVMVGGQMVLAGGELVIADGGEILGRQGAVRP